MLSFNREALTVFTRTDYDLIRLIVRELRRTDKEKVIRVALGTFKNLSDTNEDAVTLMVEHKLLEVVDSVSKRVIKDPDVIELLKDVGDVLQSSIKLLSSYEKYLVELNKGQLVAGVTHTEAFWKENARQFESDRFINIR
jgi:V-type H+-transporting ATPase subunit H